MKQSLPRVVSTGANRSERSGEISIVGMSERIFFVYVLANPGRTTLYIGITSNLSRRIEEHRMGTVVGFTKRYHCTDLIYYELFTTAYDAISREKQLKRWSRAKKLDLIRKLNPTFRDLTDDLA